MLRLLKPEKTKEILDFKNHIKKKTKDNFPFENNSKLDLQKLKLISSELREKTFGLDNRFEKKNMAQQKSKFKFVKKEYELKVVSLIV